MTELTLSEIENDTLNFLLSMPMDDKKAYFHKLIETFYPRSLTDEKEYENLLESYISSIYVDN